VVAQGDPAVSHLRIPLFAALGCGLFVAAHAVQPAPSASLQPPRHVGPPAAEHAATNRGFQGIPSLAVAPRGRLWATWYAGVTPAEDQNNYVVLATSGDGGATWSDVLVVDPDGAGPVRSFDPELWVAPDGRLFFFWAQMEKGRRDVELGVWFIETQDPDAATPDWSTPRRIGDGVMMCKPLVLSTGEWALPISRWKEHDKSAEIVVSTDAGKTWSVRGACHVPAADRDYDEHSIVERKDGSLWMLVRTKYGIGESTSVDRGATWSDLVPSKIPHPTARFCLRRLASGNLLLVKHGPLDARTNRKLLTAYVSTDDGRTWGGGLLLDDRVGVSYPDGQETPDGLIRIVYDFNRVTDRELLVATFREADAAAGRDITGAVRLRQRVSRASGGREKLPAKPPAAAAVPLWDERSVRAKAADLPVAQGTRFHVIKPQRPDVDGCRWTLGVGLCWHEGRLYASYGFNKGDENTPTEEAHVRASDDGGATWGPPVVMDDGPANLGVSHGVFLSHGDRLWAFMGAFFDRFERTHTRAYTLDEASGRWEPRGVAVENGFWPMQEPQRMADGNWIMAGFRPSKGYGVAGNLPAVAISTGDDLTRWDLVVIPPAPDLGANLWGESTVIVEGKRITNIARYGSQAVALVSTSDDCGRTWTPAAPSNMPMATSKPYAGILSTGQRYLVCTTTADSGGRRSPLTIAVGRPGERTFSQVFLVRNSVCADTPGVSDPRADFSYPYAVEHGGQLFIGYTHKSHAANELAVIPIGSLGGP
jgi:predicted neuraminidase